MSNWRYIAQRATTGEFLDLELPLHRDELSWELSGAGALRGTVAPDTGVLRAPDGRLILEEWGTLLYAEANGQIRWGGILASSKFQGGQWQIEAAGFTTYPHGQPYGGTYSKIGVDPADAVAHIWSHLQSYPDGNLGLKVTGDKTPVRLGTPPRDVNFQGNGQDVSFQTGPYELNWYDAVDCGAEIDALAKEAGFDYVERHYWSGDKIAHELRLGYPRLGRRREDLAFIQGDNIAAVVTPELDGDLFANEVLGIGSGEGAGALRRSTAVRDGRLRRASVYTAKDVSSSSRLDAAIAAELRRRQDTLTIKSVSVRDHPNAPIGSWDVGDDVLIQATLPWLGEVAVWSRITGWALNSEATATLTLARSDSFTYGGK